MDTGRLKMPSSHRRSKKNIRASRETHINRKGTVITPFKWAGRPTVLITTFTLVVEADIAAMHAVVAKSAKII
jgi:hypothetical protein